MVPRAPLEHIPEHRDWEHTPNPPQHHRVLSIPMSKSDFQAQAFKDLGVKEKKLNRKDLQEEKMDEVLGMQEGKCQKMLPKC